jgi:hypothetical protein
MRDEPGKSGKGPRTDPRILDLYSWLKGFIASTHDLDRQSLAVLRALYGSLAMRVIESWEASMTWAQLLTQAPADVLDHLAEVFDSGAERARREGDYLAALGYRLVFVSIEARRLGNHPVAVVTEQTSADMVDYAIDQIREGHLSTAGIRTMHEA